MGIKDTLLDFIDNTGLAEVFSRKPHDPTKARKPLLTGIKRTREQFAARATTVSKAPNKWWQVKNGVVALKVKVAGNVLDINGHETNHIPEERFDEFLTKFEQAVNAGEFDDELAGTGSGTAKVAVRGKAKAAPASPSITGVRRSVGKSLSNGKPLDEIEAALKAQGKYSHADIDAVIAEKRASA